MKTKFLTLLILTIPFFCSSQILWDNFEETRVAYYDFTHGGMTTRFANPDLSSSVNNSAICSEYVRNAGELYDVLVIVANGPMYDVSDYVNGTKKMTVDVYSPAAGIPVQITLEDSLLAGPTNYPTGRHSIYLGTTTVANEWETIELTFDSKPDPSMSDAGLTSLILLFNPNTNTDNTYYFDNLYGPEFDNQCNTIISNPSIDFADWDCNWNLGICPSTLPCSSYDFVSGWLEQSYNPDNSTINNSKYSGQYTRNPDGNGEDLLIAYFNNGSLDLSTNKNFNFQMYGPPRPFIISFQDANNNEVYSFNSVLTSNNQWEQFSIDLSSVASQSISRFVLFLDQGVTNWDTYYLDNFHLSSTPLNIKDVKSSNNLVVFPQPAINEISIESSILSTNNSVLYLFDLKGELILRNDLSKKSNDNRISLDISGLKSGFYLLKVQSNNQVEYQKIQVVK